jgi:hypothetical protein
VSQDHFNHEYISIENLDGLLQTCNLSALTKLRIILVWAKKLTCPPLRFLNQLRRIVSKNINPTSDPIKSFNLAIGLSDLSGEFPEIYDIVVPSSL